MAQKSGFFNAIMTNNKPDRVYTADDFNEFFKGILSDGVFQNVANAFLVLANTDNLAVTVGTGKALIKQHWYINDTVTTIVLSPAHATLARYTRIVVRYEKATRSIKLIAINGATEDDPQIPDLEQSEDKYDISLATIYIPAGATKVTAENIKDDRDYVKGLVDPTPFNYRRYDTSVPAAYALGLTQFDIPAEYNYTPNTALQVYSNGLLCKQSEYSVQVNEESGNYMIVFETVRECGADISIIMVN